MRTVVFLSCLGCGASTSTVAPEQPVQHRLSVAAAAEPPVTQAPPFALLAREGELFMLDADGQEVCRRWVVAPSGAGSAKLVREGDVLELETSPGTIKLVGRTTTTPERSRQALADPASANASSAEC
jgi:hypothetical protein